MIELVPSSTQAMKPSTARRGSAPAGWLLLAALAGATLEQGGFYAAAQWYLAGGLGAALAAGLWSGRVTPESIGRGWSTRGRSTRGWFGPAYAGAALASWAVLDGWLHGSVDAGLRPGLLVVAVGVVIGLCRALDLPAQALLASGLRWLGALVGLLGWYGVAGHNQRFAIAGQGLWRAAGTLSYPNAAAALLAVLVLQPRRWPPS